MSPCLEGGDVDAAAESRAEREPIATSACRSRPRGGRSGAARPHGQVRVTRRPRRSGVGLSPAAAASRVVDAGRDAHAHALLARQGPLPRTSRTALRKSARALTARQVSETCTAPRRCWVRAASTALREVVSPSRAACRGPRTSRRRPDAGPRPRSRRRDRVTKAHLHLEAQVLPAARRGRRPPPAAPPCRRARRCSTALRPEGEVAGLEPAKGSNSGPNAS